MSVNRRHDSPRAAPESRRGFLRALAALPLIGGGLKLLGDPTAAAAPVSLDLLRRYRNFLGNEMHAASFEIMSLGSPWAFHDRSHRLDDMSTWRDEAWWHPMPSDPLVETLVTQAPASARAAVVLSVAGVPLPAFRAEKGGERG